MRKGKHFTHFKGIFFEEILRSDFWKMIVVQDQSDVMEGIYKRIAFPIYIYIYIYLKYDVIMYFEIKL